MNDECKKIAEIGKELFRRLEAIEWHLKNAVAAKNNHDTMIFVEGALKIFDEGVDTSPLTTIITNTEALKVEK